MDFKQIQELIKIVSKSELSEVKIQQDNFKIKIKNKGDQTIQMVQNPIVSSAPVMASAPMPVAPSSGNTEKSAEPTTESSSSKGNYIEFKSPMIGTFYRKPGPDKDVFVKVGDTVKPGTVLCVVEAMKLFNEIECDVEGTIIKILLDDASPVEYDQPLFLIEPK